MAAGTGQLGAIQSVAPSFGVELSPVNVRDAGEIERAVAAFARSPNGGLIVTASALAIVHRELIVTLAARHRLPAVYFARFFVTGGGLISYGSDHHRPVPARGRLRRSHPQGREAGRPAGAGADQVRAGDQPQDRQGARPRRAADAARPRRRGDRMKRREFITLLGGAAAAWPLAARGQQGERVRRIGVLTGSGSPDDPDVKERYAAFVQRLQQLGWSDGRNLRIDAHLTASEPDDLRKRAAELAAHRPDVILAGGTSTVAPLLQATRTVPIVFAGTADPVGAGLIASLARPGGNVTGFMQFEYSLSAKWPELLKQIAPSVTRAAVLRDPVVTAGIGQFAVIQSAAPSVGIDVSPVNVRIAQEIEQAVTAFAHSPNGGLIVTASGLAAVHRDLIITLAARHKLPAVYARRLFVAEGGLMCYGADRVELFRQAAQYVDRILKGEKPADLPVQAPTKYELVINLKTARALGLVVPEALLARADEVIE